MSPAGTAVILPKAEASPEIKSLAKRANKLVSAAKLIKVTNEPDLEGATQFMRGTKTVEREIKAEIKRATDPHTQKIKEYREMGAKILKLPAEAEAIVDPMIGSYRRKRREAQVKREAEEMAKAEKLAEEEKAAKIKELEEKGDADSLEIAEEVKEAPAVVAMTEHKRSVPKQDGASGKMNWSFGIADKEQFIQRCAADPNLRKYILINNAEIGKVVRAMHKEAERVIPGISVSSDESRTYNSL